LFDLDVGAVSGQSSKETHNDIWFFGIAREEIGMCFLAISDVHVPDQFG
jgi:hypothetical protein